MVSLLVDTTSFLEAGRSAHSAAVSVERALSRAASGFAGSAHMAGSDEHGRTWASSYDEASGRIFRYTAQLHDAVATMARKLTVTGSYYELAELVNSGIADASVTLPPPVSLTSPPHIPSAAGGNRKFPNSNPAYEWVAEEISKLLGDLWPDGDTGKLDHASTVWHGLADDLDDVASSLGHIPDALAGVDTPELSKIDDQIASVKSFAKKLAAACRTIGKACNDLSGKISYVHAQTEITLGITIAAIIATIAAAAVLTPVTFGISDVAGAGGVAAETAGAVATITGFITELAATISAGVADVVASTAGLVGISADLAATIGVTVGDVTAAAVLWGTAGAAENTIVTAVTEPGSDLGAAAEEGFLSWGAGGALGGILGKTVEIIGANGKVTLVEGNVGTVAHDFGGLSEKEFVAKWSDGVGEYGPKWRWPPDDGFDGPAMPNSLEPGSLIERITATDKNGEPVDGKFASPPGEPFVGKSLPPDRLQPPFVTVTYRVLKPLPDSVLEGKAASWFDQPGGAIQYHFPDGIQQFVDEGYLDPVEVRAQ
jgi:hypothetical protein